MILPFMYKLWFKIITKQKIMLKLAYLAQGIDIEVMLEEDTIIMIINIMIIISVVMLFLFKFK